MLARFLLEAVHAILDAPSLQQSRLAVEWHSCWGSERPSPPVFELQLVGDRDFFFSGILRGRGSADG